MAKTQYIFYQLCANCMQQVLVDELQTCSVCGRADVGPCRIGDGGHTIPCSDFVVCEGEN